MARIAASQFGLAIAIVLMLTACESELPFPHPVGLPGDKWEAYRVKGYGNVNSTYTFNPFDKQNEIWEEYRLTADSNTSIRLTLTCGEWKMPDSIDDCGNGAFTPNESVWTRPGVSSEQLWVYSNKHPEKGLTGSFWHIESRDAK
jgi:hypothetical protein